MGAKRGKKGEQRDHKAMERAHEGCLWELKGAKRENKGTKRTHERCSWEPKGAKREHKGTTKRLKGSMRGACVS